MAKISERRKAKAKLYTSKNAERGLKRKDRNVARSSHGKFASVKALETHRKDLCGVVE